MKLTQKQMLLEYLLEIGHITPIDALQHLGIYRLSDTILKLRNDGYEIKTVMMKKIGKFNNVVRFARYELIKGK